MRKLVIYAAYLMIVLLILPEAFLRLCGYHGESYKGNIIRYDSRLGWGLIPNANGFDSEFEWRVRYKVNEDGLRERTIEAKKGKDAFRILVLGDSFVEGYGIRQDRRFSDLMEKILLAQGKRVEVINAGVRGYNLGQYYVFFKTLYEKYAPDLVIIAAVSGDLDVVTDTMLVDNATVYYRPYFTPGSALTVKGLPVPRPDANIFRDDKLEMIKMYLRKSALYTFLRIVSDKNILLQKILISVHVKKDVYAKPEYGKYLKYVYGPSYDPMLYNRQDNEIESKAILKDMADTVKKDGHKLTVFLLTDDSLNTNLTYYKNTKNDAGYAFGNFPDLCSEYRKAPKRYHFRFDPHFNERGHKLAAQTLAAFIAADIRPK